MSSAEFLPLFPSATHPAIPVASRILSTLRTLTAPGKGNDLKPEERAALVGVSAFLGCEKVQSKDLPESSAQKASSVSPAHFRSTLSRARRLLETVQSQQTISSPTRRSSRQTIASSAASSSPSTRSPSTTTHDTATAPKAQLDPLSPFQTPKKKFKYSSGVDISGLLRSGSKTRTPRHEHEPTTGSPLKQSVTPAKLPETTSKLGASGIKDNGTNDGDGEEVDADDVRTPTKKRKFHSAGVDLATATVAPAFSDSDQEQQSDSAGLSRTIQTQSRRAQESTAAFLALRPGVSPAQATLQKVVNDGLPEEEREYLARRREAARRRVADGPKRGAMRPKRDWTYVEDVWGSKQAMMANERTWADILQRLPEYLSTYDHATLDRPSQGGPEPGVLT